MNVIKKMFLFIKNIFIKKEKIKKLEEPNNIVKNEKKDSFINSLKKIPTPERKKKKVETLTCNGDGLGIQKDILS